jgi:hypothetical protein
MNKKFSFTGETKIAIGATLNRIKAKISFGTEKPSAKNTDSPTPK